MTSSPSPDSEQSEDVYCASPRAIAAATAAYHQRGGAPTPAAFSDALIALHGRSLSLDRSVCLRDVVEALREGSAGSWHGDYWADKLVEWFG